MYKLNDILKGVLVKIESNLKDDINADWNIYSLPKIIGKHLGFIVQRINCWDVVNEAVRDGLSAAEAAGDWKKCLRTNPPGIVR